MESWLTQLRGVINSGDVQGFRASLATHPEIKAKLDDPLFDFCSPAIRTAAERKDLAMVDALIEAGANLNQRSHWGPGGFGVLDGADRETAAQLIARGAVVDNHAATHLGDLRPMRELLDSDPALVNARGGDGGTPLHCAANLDVIFNEKLGFNPAFRNGAVFLIVARNGVEIALQLDRTGNRAGRSSCYLKLGGVDSYHRELVANGVATAHELKDEPYAMREFMILDPDGNTLNFGEPIG